MRLAGLEAGNRSDFPGVVAMEVVLAAQKDVEPPVDGAGQRIGVDRQFETCRVPDQPAVERACLEQEHASVPASLPAILPAPAPAHPQYRDDTRRFGPPVDGRGCEEVSGGAGARGRMAFASVEASFRALSLMVAVIWSETSWSRL